MARFDRTRPRRINLPRITYASVEETAPAKAAQNDSCGALPARDLATASNGASLARLPSDAIRAVDARSSGTRNLQDRGVYFRITLYPLRLF